VASEGTDRSIVLAILAMAESLNHDVVAEGIEQPAQRDALIALGCHLGQGYLFAHALPKDDATKLLTDWTDVTTPTSPADGLSLAERL
jgi:EAL domain-containing protein (putative c-di-GMP-specific phosphodiesterase class I)